MVWNQTIPYGNITVPLVSQYAKVDYALDGGLSLAIHAIVFMAIVVAFYKKDKELERGVAVAGLVTGFSSGFLTIRGYLPWQYIWMSVSLFVIAFIAKSIEKTN